TDSCRKIIAWGAVIFARVPGIIWQESGHAASFWLIGIESLIIALVALAAVWVPSWRSLVRFLLAIALLNLAWGCIAPAIANSPPVRAVTDNVSWGARLFLGRLPTLS